MEAINVKMQDFCIEKKHLEEPMSPKAAIFRHEKFDSYVLVIVGLAKKIEISSLKSGLHETVLTHKRFSSIVEKCKNGNQKWVGVDEVNLDNHIVVPELSESFTKDEGFVEKYTSSLATAPPMDPSRPLWEVHVLNHSSLEAEASVVFRVHHCIGDCVSLMSLFLHSTTKKSDPHAKPTVPKPKRRNNNPKPSSNPKAHGNISSWISWIFCWFWNMVVCTWWTFYEIVVTVVTYFWMKDPKMFRGGRDVVDQAKCLGQVTIDLQDVNIVKEAIHGTVNDVITGMLSAGFVRYFERLQEQGNSKRIDAMQIPARIRAAVPVNMRSVPGLHELKDMLGENSDKGSRWGNGFGLWILTISTKKRDKFLDYCLVAKRYLNRKKASYEAQFTFFLTSFLCHLFGVNFGIVLPYGICQRTVLTFSNVQGPVEEVRLQDCPVTRILTTVARVPQGLVVHFQSYAGKAKLVALASESVFPDPQQLCIDCLHSLKCMIEEAQNSTP